MRPCAECEGASLLPDPGTRGALNTGRFEHGPGAKGERSWGPDQSEEGFVRPEGQEARERRDRKFPGKYDSGDGGAPSAPVQQEMVGDRAAAPGAGREGLRAGRAVKSATRAAVGGALKRNPSLQPGHIEERKFKRKKLGKDDSELALNTFMFNEMFPLDGD